MGVERLPVIVAELIAHGRNADTPIALIEQGTLPEQRVIIGTLARYCGEGRWGAATRHGHCRRGGALARMLREKAPTKLLKSFGFE